MKQTFQLRETNRIVGNKYNLNLSVYKVNQVSYWEKVWDFMRVKSGTPFSFMSKLVKTLKLSKTLLKLGMVVHVTVGCVRVDLD